VISTAKSITKVAGMTHREYIPFNAKELQELIQVSLASLEQDDQLTAHHILAFVGRYIIIYIFQQSADQIHRHIILTNSLFV
jgi:hypothetical protein